MIFGHLLVIFDYFFNFFQKVKVRACIKYFLFFGGKSFLLADKPFIECFVFCQLGNQMFQIAGASALAWDNNAEIYFPNLNEEFNYEKILFRCRKKAPAKKISFTWVGPLIFRYHKIPYQPNMRIRDSYLMSYKYFEHHRERVIKLFALKKEDQDYLKKKYEKVLQHPNTVGVQVRSQRVPNSRSAEHFMFGKDFYKKAMNLFDEDALFVVTSNHPQFARSCIPEDKKNVIFIEGEDLHIDLHILSLCKHNIIPNSTFGWWAAWLNQNPNKKVVRPLKHEHPKEDYYPPEWIVVDSDYSIDDENIIENF